MRTRRLGQDGFEVGEVGLGCWQLGGADFGPVDEETAHAILAAAQESGTNFFDTADVYGAGRSERLIGTFLGDHRKRTAVASKSGRGEVYPDGYSLAALRESVQKTNERLKVDSLDLLQLHCVPHAVLQDGAIFDWLREVQAEGLIKRFGASVETVEEGLTCLAHEDLLSLQVIFNPFRQKLIEELFPRAADRGVGIIVRLPLASGLLSGKYSVDTSFGETDHRHYNRNGDAFNVGETFAGIPFAKGVALADALKPHVPDGMTLAQMTLRWILDFEEVSVVIPGATSPEQARDNASVSDLPPLSAELHAFLRDFYTREVRSHIRGPY